MNHNLVIEQNSRSVPNLVGAVANNISNVAGLEANSAQSFLNYFEQNRDYNNAWSASQARIQREWQEQQNAKVMEFNRLEAAKNRNWQEMMSNTAHQREVQDLLAAGLNPVLSAMNGNGAAVTSGATASGVSSSGAAGQTDNSMNQMMVTLLGSFLDAQTKLQTANINAINNLAVAEKQGEINKTLATMNYNFDKTLSYQKYLQDNNLQDSKYAHEAYLKERFPSSTAQWLNNLGVSLGMLLAGASSNGVDPKSIPSWVDKLLPNFSYVYGEYQNRNKGLLSRRR